MRAMIFAAMAVTATPVLAHVTVWPRESTAAAHEKYDIRVPNEKEVDTIVVEVRFPTTVRVTAFEQKPGWTSEALRDEAGKIVGVRWRGKLPPQQFTQFGLLATNPAAAGELVWTAAQTFADGTKVEWSGPLGSKTPAPRVKLAPR
jgi:uncharacterized protein YcnI